MESNYSDRFAGGNPAAAGPSGTLLSVSAANSGVPTSYDLDFLVSAPRAIDTPKPAETPSYKGSEFWFG